MKTQEDIITHSADQTSVLGRELAKSLRKGMLLCLFGELGSGKTTLTKAIAEGLGIKKEGVVSPSFVLVREHKLKNLNFYHLDLYRLKKMNELFELGYEDYLYPDGIAVIEWADRIEGLLPKDYLRIELSHKGKNERSIKIKPKGKTYSDILGKIHENFSD